MIINGKEISNKIRLDLKQKISKLDIKPTLAVIIVSNDEASKIYVNYKQKGCNEVGIKSIKHELPSSTTERELLDLIDKMNIDNDINGILVQLPLPSHIDKKKIIDTINPIKDVDGFHPVNIGNLFIGNENLVSCTPYAIIKLIETTGVKIEGSNAVVIGRSTIVGKPVAAMLINRSATVTVCHSKTKNLDKVCLNADILIAAVGKKGLVTKNMVKPGSVVIDVGMNRTDEGLFGDVDFESVKDIVSYITPVPGGVGPMTITCLLENTLKCYNLQIGDNNG